MKGFLEQIASLFQRYYKNRVVQKVKISGPCCPILESLHMYLIFFNSKNEYHFNLSIKHCLAGTKKPVYLATWASVGFVWSKNIFLKKNKLPEGRRNDF